MQWLLRSENTPPPPSDLSVWAERLEISETLAKFLWTRNVRDFEQMRLFINPGLKRLAGIDEWPGLSDTAELMVQVLLAGKQLCVWGDYDVDGITSVALVTEFFEQHGMSIRHYIPNRLTEGYGLNIQAIDALAEQGVDVLLTVDSGISDVEAVKFAKSKGMTVIITDHHKPAEELPPADAIVNPRLFSCPCPSLAGVGVAFLLMAAVNAVLVTKGRPRVDVRMLLDLVALGTLADVVDLHGQNRILVKNGLLKIAAGSRPGIAALKTACNLAPTAKLGAGQVVFSLAPRINAAGRLGSSEIALELLLTKNPARAAALADELSRMNAERRDEEDRIFIEAKEQAETQLLAGASGLVVYSPNWHPGIIGIVASRLVECFHRPAVVCSMTDMHLKGSGRSIATVDIHDLFMRCADLLIGYGGHRMAAGLSLCQEHLAPFREKFDRLVKEELGEQPVEPQCKLDGELSFSSAADFTFLKELELLQPFGMGNAEPTFVSPLVKVRNMRGRRGFMQLELEEEETGLVLQAKAWRELAAMPLSLKGRRIRVAYTPRIDRHNGIAKIELRLKDWKEEA